MKDERIVLAAKIFAITFPILIVSTMRSQIVMRDKFRKLIWSNIIREYQSLLQQTTHLTSSTEPTNNS